MLNFFYCKNSTACNRKQRFLIVYTDGAISVAYNKQKTTNDILIFGTLLFYSTIFSNFVRIL